MHLPAGGPFRRTMRFTRDHSETPVQIPEVLRKCLKGLIIF